MQAITGNIQIFPIYDLINFYIPLSPHFVPLIFTLYRLLPLEKLQ